MKDGKDSSDQKSSAELCGIILSYHRIASRALDPWGLRVSPENFKQQLSIIREVGTPISLPDFAASFQKGALPQNAIVITFDDGYLDNFTHALPLLESFDVPATVFVSTGYTGQVYFWWEALEQVFLRPNRLPQVLSLRLDSGMVEWSLADAAHYTVEQYERDCLSFKWRGEPGSRIRIYHDVYDVLWSLDHAQRLIQVDQIVSWAGMNSRSFSDSRPMTAEECIKFGKNSLITIGAHSVNHLPLDEKSAIVQKSEIVDSRKFLERTLNRPVNTFAYPHGKFCDESVNILNEHQFLCACTTKESAVTATTQPMLLPRFTVKDWEEEKFREKLAEWT